MDASTTDDSKSYRNSHRSCCLRSNKVSGERRKGKERKKGEKDKKKILRSNTLCITLDPTEDY